MGTTSVRDVEPSAARPLVGRDISDTARRTHAESAGAGFTGALTAGTHSRDSGIEVKGSSTQTKRISWK
jgi:hypothetical protein